MIYVIFQLIMKNFCKVVFCKVAKLKPLYKKGSLTQPCNYRPISLLPLIFKVIEKVIHDQTSTFLNPKYLLYIYQSGFLKKHSTDFCLSYWNDKILKGFDKDSMTGMVLIDLQRAFWHNWSWRTFEKIICYWFLEAYCKLVSILFIQQIISG